MVSDILIKVEGVGKKFCRSLKRSLWYGLNDIVSEMTGRSVAAHGHLRPDEFWAVKDVSFELRRGECLGLIGRNGAGKTTLLKMLNGLIKPDAGQITLRGRVGALIALGAGFNPILTGRENIYVNGSVLGLTKTEIDAKLEEIIDFAELKESINSPVQSYSSGMVVRLGFAVASTFQPEILLLDEVLAVGDMGFQAKCFNRLGELRRCGTSFVLVSHNMHHITRFCSSVLLLEHTEVLYNGPTEQGVDLYLNQTMDSSAGVAAAPFERISSASMELIDAYCCDPSGQRVSTIEAGQPLELRVNYKMLRCQCVIDPVIEVGFRDPMGEAFFHGSTRTQRVSIGTLEYEGWISLSFPSFPANNQALTISMAIWDSDMHELLCWCRGIRLQARGEPGSIGRVAIPCEWDNQAANSHHA